MGRLRTEILIVLSLLVTASCEKDDICVEGDTPLLVIEFYNSSDTTALKNAPTLRVVGAEQTVTVNTVVDRTTVNSISLPLKTDLDTTSFILISNSASAEDGSETGNLDTINFTYKRFEDFLSRGCGFVVKYDSLNANITPDTNNWIQDIQVIRSQVINSDSTHVKIFH